MTTYAKSFTAVGTGVELSIRKGDSFNYSVSGTFDQTWALQMSTGKGWATVLSDTTAASGTVTAERDARYRMVSTAQGETPGTMVTSLVENVRAGVTRLNIPASTGKVGATAGWVPGAADDISLATCPASKTASTLVIPVPGLKVGDKISGFYATGQIEGTSGNTATLDISLRKHTAAAADVADAAVGAMTQLSVAADTIISASNARLNDLTEVVGADESFYFLVTATTGASTDIALQSVTLEIE